MEFALRFAEVNRTRMLDVVERAFWAFTSIGRFDRLVDVHHNYAAWENHAGQNGIVHRKGAVRARAGEVVLIPGSMGTASYVVSGLGNRMSLNSSPHGAGRNYSRTKARKTFTQEQLREAMKGIEYRDTAAFIDEIPMAYKDVDVVMKDAADLVEIRHTLRQIVNVKGD
jgi:tRNA-splicing ligase RtcB (3'-phosphate/5'-hydroxy nucleic acid ligase)